MLARMFWLMSCCVLGVTVTSACGDSSEEERTANLGPDGEGGEEKGTGGNSSTGGLGNSSSGPGESSGGNATGGVASSETGGAVSTGGGSTGRGPLSGATYCELVDSCCQQLAPDSGRDQCLERMERSLEDLSSAQDECENQLRPLFNGLRCGPLVQGSLTIDFNLGTSHSFVCDLAKFGAKLAAFPGDQFAVVGCSSSTELGAVVYDVQLPLAPGHYEENGKMILRGTYVLPGEDGNTYSYDLTSSGALFIGDVVSFDEASHRLVATAKATFDGPLIGDGPAATAIVTIDSELPRFPEP